MSGTRSMMSMAPVVVAVVLAGLTGWRFVVTAPSPDTEAYMTRVADRIDALPYRIGRFIGVDADVTPGAVQLLQPNRILQRRYTDPETGESFSLVMVHCKIAKDMTGHYPPNCYPNSGWVSVQRPETVSVGVADTVIPARRYVFELQKGLTPPRLDILNFFVLPDGAQRYGSDMRLVDALSRSAAASRLGAAQVQIITDAQMDASVREAIWREALEVAFPAMSEIAGGVS